MALTEKQWARLARDVQRALAKAAPEWSERAPRDPGLGVLEALAFVLADLPAGRFVADSQARALARRIADRAAALAEPPALAEDCGPGLQRVNYFFGQLLGADDFRAEQDYLRNRLDRRNRLLYGAGIVDGLEVTVTGSGGSAEVVVAPGLAFDPRGREICIEGTATPALPADGALLLLTLSYEERPCAIVPTLAGAMTGSAGSPALLATRIVESYRLALVGMATEDAVALARLRRARGRWRLDPAFKASKLRV